MPDLDGPAVEAAARQRFHEAMRGDKDWTWGSVTEDTREAYREAERRARAVYFAALDRPKLIYTAAAALAKRGGYGDKPEGYVEDAIAVLEALGLFIPDTEEPA